MLDPTFARQRQQRLINALKSTGVDAIVISDPRHVYYLTGHLIPLNFRCALILRPGYRNYLITPRTPTQTLPVDEILTYPPMVRLDLPQTVANMTLKLLVGSTRIGYDTSDVACCFLSQLTRPINIDLTLQQMRRIKDPDELSLIQHAIHATKSMYQKARQIIEPGIPELEVYNQLYKTAVETLGEPMTALLGNDFACGSGGGMPRPGRKAQTGEIYILDLGPSYRGYFADNCRAFSVGKTPSDAQLKAWQNLMDVFPIIESLARPGVSTSDLFQTVENHFNTRFGRNQFHHLGHGVGLVPHEYPFLKTDHNDILAEGEIFTIEPGVYGAELQGGIRLENQYLVTATGVKNLTPFPMELT